MHHNQNMSAISKIITRSCLKHKSRHLEMSLFVWGIFCLVFFRLDFLGSEFYYHNLRKKYHMQMNATFTQNYKEQECINSKQSQNVFQYYILGYHVLFCNKKKLNIEVIFQQKFRGGAILEMKNSSFQEDMFF